jgi:hypothetical protein
MNKSLKISRNEYINDEGTHLVDPISNFFQHTVGKLMATPPISLSHKSEVVINQAEVKASNLKVVFTIGLYAFQNIELCICLPRQWELRRFFSSLFIEETFAVDLLREITTKCERKKSTFQIAEGLFIDKNKSPWDKLCWDEKIEGLLFVNYNWDKDSISNEDLNDDEIITIYTLVPVCKTTGKIKDRLNAISDTKHSMTWSDIAFPLNPAIEKQNLLNDGIKEGNMDKVKEAVASGAAINRGYIDEHWQFGFFTDHSILEKSFDSENEVLIRYLVENGAIVPANALAHFLGWGTKPIFEFLINNGADINAELTGMTALERAKSFKNTQGYNDLLSLGALVRV